VSDAEDRLASIVVREFAVDGVTITPATTFRNHRLDASGATFQSRFLTRSTGTLHSVADLIGRGIEAPGEDALRRRPTKAVFRASLENLPTALRPRGASSPPEHETRLTCRGMTVSAAAPAYSTAGPRSVS
jgi:hypothetical protein